MGPARYQPLSVDLDTREPVLMRHARRPLRLSLTDRSAVLKAKS